MFAFQLFTILLAVVISGSRADGPAHTDYYKGCYQVELLLFPRLATLEQGGPFPERAYTGPENLVASMAL